MKIKKLFFFFYLIMIEYCLLQAGNPDSLLCKPKDWITGQREALPAWIFNATANEIVAVSDPCLQPEIARKQALQRACCIYQFREGAKINMLTDFFSSTTVSTNSHEETIDKVLTIAKISFPEKSYSYSVLEEYTSMFGELFLKVRVGPTLHTPENTVSNAAVYELMTVTALENKEYTELKIVMCMQGSITQAPFLSEYVVRGSEERLIVNSEINSTALELPGDSYWYCNHHEEAKEFTNFTKSELKNSFWSAYMVSLLKVILSHAYPEVKVKQVSEVYEDFSRDFSREFIDAKTSVSSSIKGIADNLLLIDHTITSN